MASASNTYPMQESTSTSGCIESIESEYKVASCRSRQRSHKRPALQTTRRRVPTKSGLLKMESTKPKSELLICLINYRLPIKRICIPPCCTASKKKVILMRKPSQTRPCMSLVIYRLTAQIGLQQNVLRHCHHTNSPSNGESASNLTLPS